MSLVEIAIVMKSVLEKMFPWMSACAFAIKQQAGAGIALSNYFLLIITKIENYY